MSADRSGDALAQCVDVSRAFGRPPADVVAVRGVSCWLRPGDRVALVGPSGSGKSTLLHLLAGIDRPTSGAVSWPGLGGGPPALRPGTVGLVFQGPSLLPDLDVGENVALPLLLAGEPEAVSADRAGSVLAALGLDDLGPKLPEELSGGQAQRVAVARALAGRPRLLLADEPTGQLDRATGGRVVDALLAAAEGDDVALLVATHDPAVAARLPARWSMADGRLVAMADVDQKCWD